MSTLTKQQLERQDFVDNAIFELVKSLTPQTKQLKWDIETISLVRETIQNCIVKQKIMNKMQFYPYLKI